MQHAQETGTEIQHLTLLKAGQGKHTKTALDWAKVSIMQQRSGKLRETRKLKRFMHNPIGQQHA